MTATETTDSKAHVSLLESWSANEVLRHIPTQEWIIGKLDGDLRTRIEKLSASCTEAGANHPSHAAAETEMKALGRALERLVEIAKTHKQNGQPPHDLASRVIWTLNQALTAIRTQDPSLFGRRFPFQTLERSKFEPLWAAVLVVIQHVQRLTDAVRLLDDNIDAKLLDKLVELQNPVDAQTLKPIA